MSDLAVKKVFSDPAFAFVLRFCPTILESRKTDNKHEIAKKITHLYLNNKFINRIGTLKPFSNLNFLYLHENKIKKIENLENCMNLTHLYLQRNEITKIEGLSNLHKLKKLYIGYNLISVVEGLENLQALVELHIEKQLLQESLCFDPRTVIALRPTLKILNVSNNYLNSLSDIQHLESLEILNATNNKIVDLDATAKQIQSLVHLKDITLKGNPITKNLKYRDQLIINTLQLQIIDGKEVQDNTRIFLKNFEIEKNNSCLNSKVDNSISDEVINFCPSGLQTDLKRSVNKFITNGPKLNEAMYLNKIEVPGKPQRCIPSFTTMEGNTDEELFLPWNRLPHCTKPRTSSKRKPSRSIHTLNS